VDVERGRCVELGGETSCVLGFRGWQVKEAEEAEGVKAVGKLEEVTGEVVGEVEKVDLAELAEWIEGLAGVDLMVWLEGPEPPGRGT
jgi:hypothetical protein